MGVDYSRHFASNMIKNLLFAFEIDFPVGGLIPYFGKVIYSYRRAYLSEFAPSNLFGIVGGYFDTDFFVRSMYPYFWGAGMVISGFTLNPIYSEERAMFYVYRDFIGNVMARQALHRTRRGFRIGRGISRVLRLTYNNLRARTDGMEELFSEIDRLTDPEEYSLASIAYGMRLALRSLAVDNKELYNKAVMYLTGELRATLSLRTHNIASSIGYHNALLALESITKFLGLAGYRGVGLFIDTYSIPLCSEATERREENDRCRRAAYMIYKTASTINNSVKTNVVLRLRKTNVKIIHELSQEFMGYMGAERIVEYDEIGLLIKPPSQSGAYIYLDDLISSALIDKRELARIARIALVLVALSRGIPPRKLISERLEEITRKVLELSKESNYNFRAILTLIFKLARGG